VADDDPTYRSLLKALLKKWDFEAVLVSNGLEALEIMAQPDAPQLVILDWEMPELDGFEVAKRIRDDKVGNDTYILLITGSRKKNDITRVLVCGADDYLIKPFDPIDLKIHLRSAVRIVRLQAELDELKRTVHHETAKEL